MPGPGLKLLKLRTHVTTIFSPPPTTNSAPADDAYDDAYMLACAVRACNGQQKCDAYPSSVCSVLKVQQQADKNTAEACYPLQEAGERGGTPRTPRSFSPAAGRTVETLSGVRRFFARSPRSLPIGSREETPTRVQRRKGRASGEWRQRNNLTKKRDSRPRIRGDGGKARDEKKSRRRGGGDPGTITRPQPSQ